MKKKISIFHNSIMNIVLTISSFIFPIVTFPYVSRILLPEGMGKVSFATSVMNCFLIIAQLGIPTYGIRACAKVRDDKEELSKTVHEILCINLCMCVISYVLLIGSICLIPRLEKEKILLFVVGLNLFFTTVSVEWLYRALEKYAYITCSSIIFKFIALITMFLFVHCKEDYVIYGAITILASSASGIANFSYLHKFIYMKRRYRLDLSKHIKPILVLFAVSCATTVYLNLDTVMLGFMKSDIDVGYYNAAVKIKNVLVSIVTSVGAVLLPRVTYYLENGEADKLKNLSIKAVQSVFFLAVPMMFFFVVHAQQTVLFLSGEEYYAAILPMQCMVPTLLFIGLTNIMGIQILVPLGKENKVLFSVIVGACIDLVINVLLIPKHGATGAAIGTMVAEVMVFVVQYFSERKFFNEIFIQTRPLKIVLASIVGTLASFFVLYKKLSSMMSLILGGGSFLLVYLMCLYILKEPFFEEIQRIIKEKL